MNFAGKLKKFFGVGSSLPDDFFCDLTDLLVEGDFGAGPAMKLVDRLEKIAQKEKINNPTELKDQFINLLSGELISGAEEISDNFNVILLLGVNGVGKTTTAAKLAYRYFSMGKVPILAAADTFRAGAINQLKIHGEKLNIRVVAHQQGGDPAAVVYDAVEAALASGGNIVIADTAGRMHTKTALVEELKKIDRVLEKAGNRPACKLKCIKWLVLDATTGRNALTQAETFHDAVSLDGAILTKYDSSARGGIVFSIASELKLPTVFLCDGEGYGNIKLFDKTAFAQEFAGG